MKKIFKPVKVLPSVTWHPKKFGNGGRVVSEALKLDRTFPSKEEAALWCEVEGYNLTDEVQQ